MKITLSPLASDKTTIVSVKGLCVTIDGLEYDLSVIPEGGQAETDEPFIGIATRDSVTIQYHYNEDEAETEQSTNWEDYTFYVTEGEVPSPIKWRVS